MQVCSTLLKSHFNGRFRDAHREERPERALLRTSGVSSAGTGTSGTPESDLVSLSEAPSLSLPSVSEPWRPSKRKNKYKRDELIYQNRHLFTCKEF